jgi:integrase
MAPKKNQIAPHVEKRTKKSGQSYYYYKMPDGSLESLGSSHKDAVEAAAILTTALRPSGDLISKILSNASTKPNPRNPFFSQVLSDYVTNSLDIDKEEGKLSKETYRLKVMVIDEYIRNLGHLTIQDITSFDLAHYIKDRTGNTQAKHIALLNRVFKYAISGRGYINSNPVSQLVAKEPAKRKRKRHTMEGLEAVRAASPVWLQRAIDIALYSLQRRGDLVRLHIDDHIDKKQKSIRVLQEKTKNYANPVFIEISAGDVLWKAIESSIKSEIPCPYLVHFRPVRIKASDRDAKPHPFAVLPDYLTKAFKKYRDLSGAYDHLPRNERPTFHSIRALGIMLYFKAGFSIDYIMSLAGHADEKTTQLYIEGHEKKRAVKVSAGLDLANVEMSDIDWLDVSLPSEIASLLTDFEE